MFLGEISLNKNKQLIINLSANFISYIVNFGISFFLSPYIIENVGVDAYGFIGLANNFIAYAGLITIAINSMAGRFVTIKIHKNDIKAANKYYSSVFIANSFLASIMGIIFAILLIFLQNIINIPKNLIFDVKILFAFLFFNCLVSTLFSIFNIATFATNKLYLSSVRTIESQIIRTFLIILLFYFFSPRVSYLGITTFICGIYVVVYNFYYSKKLLPNLKIKRSNFEFAAIKELFFSGVWNLITRIGQILLEGLDLLVTNILINPIAMGVLSVSKTIPSIITGLVGSVAGVFSPNFTILYAEGKIKELTLEIKKSMKIMGIITNIPIIVLLVCGKHFYSLWQPTQDAKQLYLLSVLSCCAYIISGGINSIFNIFTVVNKLKFNSILVLVNGLINIVLVVLLIKFTNLGVFAVAGVSSITLIIKNLVFVVPYGAKCLGLKWNTFFAEVFKCVVYVAVNVVLSGIVTSFINLNSWIGLIIKASIVLISSLLIGFLLFLNRNEKQIVFERIKNVKKV